MWRSVILCVASLLLLCAVADAQLHGVQFGSACMGPRCVKSTTDCLILVRHADSFGDTFAITAVWGVIEPTTLNIRVPAVGSLPIASIQGNARCTNAGGLCQANGMNCALPCYVGAPFSTLSNLPGSSLPGEIHFRENQYVIQPGDPNPLGVQANMDVHDLCDSPTTHGCTGVAGSLQFTSITKWCAKPSPMCSGCDARFQTCMAGPASAPNPLPPVTATECIESFDLNANGRVDLRDFAIYQVEFTRE